MFSNQVRYQVIPCAVASVFLAHAPTALIAGNAFPIEKLEIISETCDAISIPVRLLNSKRAVERFIAKEIRSSFQMNGIVDWGCLALEFEAVSDNASVIVYMDVRNQDGSVSGDTYRFTLDRTDGFWGVFARYMPVPGGSNGVFTAIVKFAADGKVFIIQRGGVGELLELE